MNVAQLSKEGQVESCTIAYVRGVSFPAHDGVSPELPPLHSGPCPRRSPLVPALLTLDLTALHGNKG